MNLKRMNYFLDVDDVSSLQKLALKHGVTTGCMIRTAISCYLGKSDYQSAPVPTPRGPRNHADTAGG